MRASVAYRYRAPYDATCTLETPALTGKKGVPSAPPWLRARAPGNARPSMTPPDATPGHEWVDDLRYEAIRANHDDSKSARKIRDGRRLAAFRDHDFTPDPQARCPRRRSLRFREQHPSLLTAPGDRFRRDDANVKLNMAGHCRGGGS